MAAMTFRLPRSALVVGCGIYWQQPACTAGAVARAGGSPYIPSSSALYLHHPCSLPRCVRASCPSADRSRPMAAWGQVLGCLATGGGLGPLVRVEVLFWPASAPKVGICCTDNHTGVLQKRLSLRRGQVPVLPMGPQQPQAGAGTLSGSTWCPAERSSSAPLCHTCMRCTGAEGNRFPSVSCAAAEPCAGPAQCPVPALPCTAATLARALTGGRAWGAPAPACGP